ncbi:MAG: conjugal transfer protein, partial [Streptococcus sp.]
LTFFCADFGERDRTQETLLYVDEAWQILLTPSGRQLLARIKRTGRSFNNFLVLVTQSVKDVSTEDDGTGFGTVFAFSEDSETSSILEHLKIKEDDLSKAWVENQTMGQCIFSDVFGRRERITVDGTIYDSITPLYATVTTNLKSAS